VRALDDNEPSLLLRVAGVLGVMVVALRCYSDMHTTVWPLFFVVVVGRGRRTQTAVKALLTRKGTIKLKQTMTFVEKGQIVFFQDTRFAEANHKKNPFHILKRRLVRLFRRLNAVRVTIKAKKKIQLN
jgi:hypothetical protein